MAATGPRDVAVVTAWLPTRVRPAMGAFVQSMLDATLPANTKVKILTSKKGKSRSLNL